MMRALAALLLVNGLCVAPVEAIAQQAPETEEEAATQYATNLKRLLEERIVPALTHGIVEISSSRPKTLTIDVTDDPSPYNVGANLASDGALRVRLSIGYTTMHDAALDAVALSAVLGSPSALRRYLVYQLRLAHQNYWRRAKGSRPRPARTFAEFVRLDPNVTQRIFAQPEWRAARDRVQVDSLGWVIAHLLVRANPKLAGDLSSSALRNGIGAARLAAASGWFPVPPMATALDVAAIERSPGAPFDEHAVLCRAADLMDAGVAVLRTSTDSRGHQGDFDAARLAEIREQIAKMRQDGQCASGTTVEIAVRPEVCLVESQCHTHEVG